MPEISMQAERLSNEYLQKKSPLGGYGEEKGSEEGLMRRRERTGSGHNGYGERFTSGLR